MSLNPEPDQRDDAAAPAPARGEDGNARALELERRLTVPVLVAAVASVPAVFLLLAGGTLAVVGNVLNWVSATVLVGEAALLLALSHERYDWIRQRKWTLLVTVAAVPAVVFFVGPVQVLRVILYLWTVQLWRVWRIIRAGRLIRQRLSWRWWGPRGRLLAAGMAVLGVAFVAVALGNPESSSRRLISQVLEQLGVN